MVRHAWEKQSDSQPVGGPKVGGGNRFARSSTTSRASDSRFGSMSMRGDMDGGREDTDSSNHGHESFDDNSQPAVDSNSPTLLYSLIKASDWEAAIERAHEERSESGTWIVEKNVDGSVRWRLLPLHQACEMKAPEEVVQTLISVYPPAVMIRDSGGDLPIHLACRECADKDVVNSLLLSNPDTAKIPDDEGRLPIHLACRQGAGSDIVNNLLVSFHKGARTTDSYGLLPLHWACAQNADLPMVEALLRANPDATESKDKWGRTPLSLAQASTNAEKDKIIAALKRDPSFWTSSLLSEVAELKGKLDEKEQVQVEYHDKASNLERKLVEVTTVSSAAAMSFRELKNELEAENKQLQKQVNELSEDNERCEQKIDDLSSDNRELREKAEDLAIRLDGITDAFRSMEEQRLKILKVTGEWEDSLQKAAELLIWDENVSEIDE